MPTTEPCQTLWTPTEVTALIGVISTVFLSALGYLATRVIEAIKNARIAVINAQAALSASATNKGTTDQMSKQMDGLQQQVTAALIATPPPPAPQLSPVVPVTFPSAPGGAGR